MKKFFNKVKATIHCGVCNLVFRFNMVCYRAKHAVINNAGEGYIDTALKVLMAVVIGALLLGGLYALFDDTLLPTLTRRISSLFDYTGG